MVGWAVSKHTGGDNASQVCQFHSRGSISTCYHITVVYQLLSLPLSLLNNVQSYLLLLKQQAFLTMNLQELFQQVNDFKTAWHFLQQQHILRTAVPNCWDPNCNQIMTKVKCANRANDLKYYRCLLHKNTNISVQEGSFLAGQNIQLADFVLVMYLWAHHVPNNTASSLSGLSEKAIQTWYLYLRQACSHYLVEHPFCIRVVGHTVEIDESVVAKWKFHAGWLICEVLTLKYDRVFLNLFLTIIVRPYYRLLSNMCYQGQLFTVTDGQHIVE